MLWKRYPPKKEINIKKKIFSIPGLSLNPHTKNPRKIVQNLLSKDLKDKNNVVIWHDVINNSISRHDSNNFNALSVPDLIDVLISLQDKLSSLVSCHRFRTPYIFDALNVLETDYNIKVFNVVKDFISSKKQKNPKLLKKFRALHQSPELELKNLDLLLRKENELSSIKDKRRPKRPSKRARNASKKALLASLSQ